MPNFSNTKLSMGNVVGSFVSGWPMEGYITQIFGQQSVSGNKHGGMDIAAPYGTPIYAADDGTIKAVNTWGSFGNWIVVGHADYLYSGYAHLSGFASSMWAGRFVQAGELLGYCGSTGLSTGNHLHWMVGPNPNFALNFTELRDPAEFIYYEEMDVALQERVSRLERLMGANGVSTTPVTVDNMGNPIMGGLITGEAAMQWMDAQGFSMHLGFAIQEAKVRKLWGGI